MEEIKISLVALGLMGLQGAALFAIVYLGTRLAIRHERRGSV